MTGMEQQEWNDILVILNSFEWWFTRDRSDEDEDQKEDVREEKKK